MMEVVIALNGSIVFGILRLGIERTLRILQALGRETGRVAIRNLAIRIGRNRYLRQVSYYTSY